MAAKEKRGQAAWHVAVVTFSSTVLAWTDGRDAALVRRNADADSGQTFRRLNLPVDGVALQRCLPCAAARCSGMMSATWWAFLVYTLRYLPAGSGSIPARPQYENVVLRGFLRAVTLRSFATIIIAAQ